MLRGDICQELHFAHVLVGEASMRARFGEWGLVSISMTKAYLKLRDAAQALELDLDAESRRLEAEEKSHAH
jgi:hypothetical protein